MWCWFRFFVMRFACRVFFVVMSCSLVWLRWSRWWWWWWWWWADASSRSVEDIMAARHQVDECVNSADQWRWSWYSVVHGRRTGSRFALWARSPGVQWSGSLAVFQTSFHLLHASWYVQCSLYVLVLLQIILIITREHDSCDALQHFRAPAVRQVVLRY